jgi:hypothetical protein
MTAGAVAPAAVFCGAEVLTVGGDEPDRYAVPVPF